MLQNHGYLQRKSFIEVGTKNLSNMKSEENQMIVTILVEYSKLLMKGEHRKTNELFSFTGGFISSSSRFIFTTKQILQTLFQICFTSCIYFLQNRSGDEVDLYQTHMIFGYVFAAQLICATTNGCCKKRSILKNPFLYSSCSAPRNLKTYFWIVPLQWNYSPAVYNFTNH